MANKRAERTAANQVAWHAQRTFDYANAADRAAAAGEPQEARTLRDSAYEHHGRAWANLLRSWEAAGRDREREQGPGTPGTDHARADEQMTFATANTARAGRAADRAARTKKRRQG